MQTHAKENLNVSPEGGGWGVGGIKMTAETQPFKAAQPACSLETRRWTVGSCTRADRRACTQTCMQPQTQQHIHEYTLCCMIALGGGGKSPFLSLLLLPFFDASAEAESQSSLTAEECFTPVMSMACSPFSLISFSLSFRLSSEGTITRNSCF